ncbi:hypothetical protein C487_03653 [Natrinema pallidum DSM 3751]|uniref:Uncharacterized protein n=1 Tax=Natrinema pallidum DSM 3751 TaxID=1227495 RepID=L9Z5Z3_9EURY|nr:hypothetical protein C487_03653 [Natrinema pallidum DSM 3751]
MRKKAPERAAARGLGTFILPRREVRAVIVVATTDFEVYHGVVNELRDRGTTFTTIACVYPHRVPG